MWSFVLLDNILIIIPQVFFVIFEVQQWSELLE